MDKIKIGIMGGTFNPIHYGHLILAENSYNQFKLNKVLFMPVGIPPHKENHGIVSALDRMNMINLAISDNSHFEVSDFEVKREGTTYTARTLELLVKENQNYEYYFIVGADSLFYMDKWLEPETIFRLSKIIVANRNHSLDSLIDSKMLSLKNEFNAEIFKLDTPCIDISSNEIRNRVKNNTIKYLVPDSVKEYIYEKKLYMNKV